MNDVLIADSGGTKIAWAGAFEAITQGYNAVTDTGDSLTRLLSTVSSVRPEIKQVFFFGAGITGSERKKLVEFQLSKFFPNAAFTVESDMVGASLALCGRSPGVACILGTGANSALWDGSAIVANTPALGYIIGDEGSGAVMGRNFLEYLLKHRFSPEVERNVEIDCAKVISSVYRGENPRAFLASFAPTILTLSEKYPEVRSFVIDQFVNFFTFNIRPYKLPSETPINFTGGIAVNFSHLLAEAAVKAGFTLGRVVPDPIVELKKLLLP